MKNDNKPCNTYWQKNETGSRIVLRKISAEDKKSNKIPQGPFSLMHLRFRKQMSEKKCCSLVHTAEVLSASYIVYQVKGGSLCKS